MKFKQKLIILSSLAVFLGLTFVLGNYFSAVQRQNRGNAKPVLAGITEESIGRLEFFSEEGIHSLDKTGDWFVKSGNASFPADRDKIESFIRELASLPHGKLASAKEEYWSSFGVDGTKGVSIYDGTDKLLATLYVGNADTTGEKCYVRLEGDSRVYMTEAIDYLIMRLPNEWGDMRIVKNENPGQVISFRYHGVSPFTDELVEQDYEVYKSAENRNDWVIRGDDSVLIQSTVDSTANQLLSLSAAEYADEIESPHFGFDQPWATLDVQLSSGTSYSLTIGAAREEGQTFYVSSSLDDYVYVVSKWSLDRLLVPKEVFIDVAATAEAATAESQ